jgi:hypothetical protein
MTLVMSSWLLSAVVQVLADQIATPARTCSPHHSSSTTSRSQQTNYAAAVLTKQEQRQVIDVIREAVGHQHANAVDDVRDARRTQRLSVLRDAQSSGLPNVAADVRSQAAGGFADN